MPGGRPWSDRGAAAALSLTARPLNLIWGTLLPRSRTGLRPDRRAVTHLQTAAWAVSARWSAWPATATSCLRAVAGRPASACPASPCSPSAGRRGVLACWRGWRPRTPPHTPLGGRANSVSHSEPASPKEATPARPQGCSGTFPRAPSTSYASSRWGRRGTLCCLFLPRRENTHSTQTIVLYRPPTASPQLADAEPPGTVAPQPATSST